MKRFGVAALAVFALAAICVGAVGATPPRVGLRHFVCQRALNPVARVVAVTAVMRPVPGTVRMALRFQLLAKTKPGGLFSPVRGGDLGSWIGPANPTLGQRAGDVWMLDKQVADLAAPAAYRFRVYFRWLGARDHVLATAQRDSAVCAQPELRPDLMVASIAVQPVPGSSTSDRYVATIRNGGATAAGPFEVLFSPGGALKVKAKLLPGLRAHSQTRVQFAGPLCNAASPPTIAVDPNDRVNDYNRSNNSLSATCPGS